MSLRARVALAVVVLAGGATVVVGAVSYNTARSNLEAEIRSSLDPVVESALRLTRNVRTIRPGGPTLEARRVGLPSSAAVVQLIGPEGSTVIESDGLSLPVSPEEEELAGAQQAGRELEHEVTVDGERFVVRTVSLGDGVGAVQAARSLAEVERVLVTVRARLLVLVLAVAAAAAVAGWLIATQLTRRLARLTDTAVEVARTGALDVDVPVGGSDESGKLSTAFNDMLAALRTSRADQRRLIEDASHELRTPITSLRTNVALLGRLAELPDDQRQALLTDLEGETVELSALVDELVELATERYDHGDPEPVDVVAVADRVAERTTRRTGRAVIVRGDGLTISGRPSEIERSIRNLVENAVKFDTEGAEPIEVEVSAARVAVLDRGPGVDPVDRPHLFDRFYRSSAARSQPGSGLGLSIVAEMAARYGGAGFVDARSGGGSIVGFTWAPEVLSEM